MWWRALGVAVVLLGVGGAVGYAVADRTEPEPVRASEAAPVPAVSPAVPTPPALDIYPDPDAPALAPGVPTTVEELRRTRRGSGVAVAVPDGWIRNRLPEGETWTFVPAINTRNTYGLRIEYVAGLRQSVAVAKTARLAALRQAQADGNLEGLEVTAGSSDGFEATYVDGGYLRLTMERWVAATPGGTAYVEIAVTGRTVDEEGLRDLLAQVVTSASPLEPLPPEPPESSGSPSPTP